MWVCLLLSGSICSQPRQQEADLGAPGGGEQQDRGGGGVGHGAVLPSGLVLLVSSFRLSWMFRTSAALSFTRPRAPPPQINIRIPFANVA